MFKPDYISLTLQNSFQLGLSPRKKFLQQFSLCHEMKMEMLSKFWFWWCMFFCFAPFFWFVVVSLGFFVSLILGGFVCLLLVCWGFFKTSFIFNLLEVWNISILKVLLYVVDICESACYLKYHLWTFSMKTSQAANSFLNNLVCFFQIHHKNKAPFLILHCILENSTPHTCLWC